MIVTTANGSVYEIDRGHMLARKQPGAWQPIDAAEFVCGRLCLVWKASDRETLTSRVVRVVRDDGTELLFGGAP